MFLGDETIEPKSAMCQHIHCKLPLRAIKSNARVYHAHV
jgi:hypothetical protein